MRLVLRALPILALCGPLLGCQSLGIPMPDLSGLLKRDAPPATPEPTIESDVYRRAELTRSEFFEREVERLRADLRQAEESIVAMESGLRGFQSRADAVSALAEARIALDRIERRVPWREDQGREARAKLSEATNQLERGHVGSAVFFASRAQRITTSLLDEARQVEEWSDRRVIGAKRVNLRAGPSLEHRVIDRLAERTPVFPERGHADWKLVRTPSGQVGWVHESLLRQPGP
ncbi:MAG: SH3 domain-containing protein [Myxococcota bacterium]